MVKYARQGSLTGELFVADFPGHGLRGCRVRCNVIADRRPEALAQLLNEGGLCDNELFGSRMSTVEKSSGLEKIDKLANEYGGR